MVTNFDPVRQAGMWLGRGAETSTELLIGMLRTALLLGGEVVIDRSQLLDGVFFLALGPDGIARRLGLDESEPLPITVMCNPEPFSGRGDPRLVPSGGPEQISWARQLDDVRKQRFMTASSAMAAITGTAHESNPWLTPPAQDPWFPGCGFVDRFHPLDPCDAEAAARVIHAAQERWVESAEHARIRSDRWGSAGLLSEALKAQREALEGAAGGLTPDQLAIDVLGVQAPERKVVTAWLTRYQHERHRSDEDLRFALALWSRAYYQAIARQSRTMLIAFNDDGVSAELNGADASKTGDFDTARRFGLALPVRSRWQRWRDRNIGVVSGHKPMRVEGEILDHMRVIDPGAFHRLLRASTDVVASVTATHDPADMYNLALACRAAAGTSLPSRRRVLVTVWARVVVMVTLGMGVAVLSILGQVLNFTRFERIAIGVVGVVLAFLAGLPWDTIVQQYGLRRSAMTATLKLTE